MMHLGELAEAQARITEDPLVMGGVPARARLQSAP